MKKQNDLSKFLGWIITILIPPILLMISIRLMITPLFPRIEYRLPGFPEDLYGFTLKDRLNWATPSINYLVNSEEIDDLEKLRFDNGEPIYNERELGHMEDVKRVVTGMRITLAILLVVLLLLTILVKRYGSRNLVRIAYQRGGWGIVGVIAAILIFVVLSFNDLFTWFHQIFFVGGTWLFNPSDTLIRLFPMRFWQDAFIFVGLGSMLMGAVIIMISRQVKADRGN